MNVLSERELRMNQQTAMAAAPRPPVTQRLQELETLRATGVITDAEYSHKREQIISEL
jgi:hypothetical protein